MKNEANVTGRTGKQELLGVGREQGQRQEGTHFVQGVAMSPAISTGALLTFKSTFPR